MSKATQHCNNARLIDTHRRKMFGHVTQTRHTTLLIGTMFEGEWDYEFRLELPERLLSRRLRFSVEDSPAMPDSLPDLLSGACISPSALSDLWWNVKGACREASPPPRRWKVVCSIGSSTEPQVPRSLPLLMLPPRGRMGSDGTAASVQIIVLRY
eukprot:scaffold23968_cov42-Prasinocladus_malaysianus.AAC.1